MFKEHKFHRYNYNQPIVNMLLELVLNYFSFNLQRAL